MEIKISLLVMKKNKNKFNTEEITKSLKKLCNKLN